MRQRRRNISYPDPVKDDPGRWSGIDDKEESMFKPAIERPLIDYIKFAFFCMLLIVPIYAIAVSAIRHDWVMMIIDALLVPIGFVHGILLFFGYLN